MESLTYDLDNIIYGIMPPPPTKALPLCNRAALLVGPLLGSLTKGKGKEFSLDIFAEALQSVDPEKVDRLLMDAVTVSRLAVGDQTLTSVLTFDQHFSKYKQHCYKVMLWCLWETVKDFFPVPGDVLLQTVKSAVSEAMASPSPTGGATSGGLDDLAGPVFVPSET